MNLGNIVGARAGKDLLLRAMSLGVVAAIILTGAQETRAANGPELGLVSDYEYVGQQFIWNAAWSETWTADTSLTASVADQYEQLVLHGDSANFGVLFSYDTMADAFAREVDLSSSDMVVLSTDAWIGAWDVPYLSATVEIFTDNGPVVEYLEVAPALANSYAPGSQVTMLVAPEDDFAEAFEDAQNEIVPYGGDEGPIFAGTPEGISESGGSNEGSAANGDAAYESAYLDALSTEMDTLTQSMDDFQTLIQNPAWDDQTWKNAMANILFTWLASYDTAQSIVPPDRYLEMHQTYIDATSLLAGAAASIAQGDFETAADYLTEAQTSLMRLERMLESDGVDIFDAKSG